MCVMSKKGFTLMELLAVILILAILALLILPVVNKIVEGARDSANQRSVEGYIGDLNYAIMEKVLLEKNDKIKECKISEICMVFYLDLKYTRRQVRRRGG